LGLSQERGWGIPYLHNDTAHPAVRCHVKVTTLSFLGWKSGSTVEAEGRSFEGQLCGVPKPLLQGAPRKHLIRERKVALLQVPKAKPFGTAEASSPDALLSIRIHTTGQRITEKHLHLSRLVIAVDTKSGGT
jgi:hypothetical protein